MTISYSMQTLLFLSQAKDFFYEQSLKLWTVMTELLVTFKPQLEVYKCECVLKRRKVWEDICQKEADHAKNAENEEWISDANALLLQAINQKDVAMSELERAKKSARKKARKSAIKSKENSKSN